MSRPHTSSLPTVSIAMATYNGARYIRAQLASFAAQTHPPHELVVTDDGSNDDTLAIIAEFGRTVAFPVHIHRNEVNLGFRDNFLKAASLCTGELVAFSDQDDVWHPEKLERCAREFLDRDVLLCLHNGEVVDGELKPVGRLVQTDLHARRVVPRMTLDVHFHAQGMRIVCATWLVRDFDWKTRPTIYSTDQPNQIMDHDFWVIYLARMFGTVVMIPDHLISYRQHGANVAGIASEVVTPERLKELTRMASGASYAKWAELSARQERYLTTLAATATGERARQIRENARAYGRTAFAYDRRARLHADDASIVRRAFLLTEMVFGRAYTAKPTGGLGWKSFLKDAAKTATTPPALKAPGRWLRCAAASALRVLPVDSRRLGPPKGTDGTFADYVARTGGTTAITERVIVPSTHVSLPATGGAHGETDLTYDSPPAAVYTATGARVIDPPHAIIGPDDRVLGFASGSPAGRPSTHPIFQQVKLGPVHRLDGRTLFFGGGSDYVDLYFGALQRVALLQLDGRTLKDFDHVIAKKPETQLERMLYKSLGLTPEKLIKSDSFRHIECASLTFFADPTPQLSPAVVTGLRELAFRAARIPAELPATRRIVVRNGDRAPRPENEGEIVDWLKTQGFAEVSLDTLPGEDQIKFFREAPIVVGVHGAGLSGMIFAAPGARLIELRPPSVPGGPGEADRYQIAARVVGAHPVVITGEVTTKTGDAYRIALPALQAALAPAVIS